MTRLDIHIHQLMKTLSETRPVFHSEADFQHAFAWALHQQWPDTQVRLELPITVDTRVLHLDVWAVIAGQPLAIELKYKTALLDAQVRDERFHLRNHSAQDIGRYDFIQDIERIETITAANALCTGWAIILTNDAQYWRPRPGGRPVDSAYRLAEGRTLHGELAWGPGASSGTMKNHERPLVLRDRKHRSAIVIFTAPGEDANADIEKRLKAVNVRYAVRGGGIRLAPHCFNSEDEIGRVAEALGKV